MCIARNIIDGLWLDHLSTLFGFVSVALFLGLLKQISLSDVSSFFSKPGEAHDTADEHPTHGFKRDLIRVVGNMCYKNKTMQDKVTITLFLNQMFVAC